MMRGALEEVQMILDLYGETDVFLLDEPEKLKVAIEDCPECGEPLDNLGWCENGCLDDLDEADFEVDLIPVDLDEVRAGVDYAEDDLDEDEEGYVR